MTVLATVVLVLALVFVADAADRCYDCDPIIGGESCVDPVKNNIRIMVCDQAGGVPSSGVQQNIDDVNKNDIDIKFGTEKKEYDCYTLYFESGDPRFVSGIYRGCTDRPPDAKSSCDVLRETLKDGNVTKCESCKDNECNRDELRLRLNDSGSGTNSIQLSVVLANLLIFVAIFAM